MMIISGGQTGADQAGLAVAEKLGISTGGWMPKGYLTSDGPRKDLAEKYNLLEHEGGYRARTWENVKMADVTIRLGVNFRTPGELCTKSAIIHYQKKWKDIPLHKDFNPKSIIHWLKNSDANIINIAGNRQNTLFQSQTWDIYKLAYKFLFVVLYELKS